MDGLYSLGALVEPLCLWYRENKRSMPWRDDPAPYHVWLSEIMLQQTRIEAVKAYYERFTKKLPDVEALAAVSEEELLKLWEGLGYYNRARNLKKAAVLMVERYDGKLPADYELLMELPGIGSYTAGAVASIAYGIPAPAVDGNVLRVTMRFLNCRDDIGRMAVRKKMERSVMDVIPKDCPGDFNQALMELGETVCIPNGVPLCEKCPLENLCAGHQMGNEKELPVRKEKKARRVEKRTILVFERNGCIGITRRPDSGLLAGLWEFPSLDGHMGISGLREWLKERKINVETVARMGRAKHIFSHVEWHMTGYRIVLAENTLPDIVPGLVWAQREQLSDMYAVPVAFLFFLEQIFASVR